MLSTFFGGEVTAQMQRDVFGDFCSFEPFFCVGGYGDMLAVSGKS
jgi:hypothetical protein